MRNDRGVFILANDAVYDLTLAFLNSFRRFNPDLPICIIPFDSDCKQIEWLAVQFGCSVFRDSSILDRCDQISRSLYGRAVGQFRKLAAWMGGFQEFIYIDVDTLVLRSFDDVFWELRDFGVLTGHSHIKGSRRFVWICDEPPHLLSAEEFEFAANTGFFMSRKGALGLAEVEALVAPARILIPYMAASCAEQPFFNFVFVKLLAPYSSLHRIGELCNRIDMFTECWAGDPNWEIGTDGQSTWKGEQRTALFVHWAGEWAPTESHPKSSMFCIRENMGKIGLWTFYREYECSAVRQRSESLACMQGGTR